MSGGLQVLNVDIHSEPRASPEKNFFEGGTFCSFKAPAAVSLPIYDVILAHFVAVNYKSAKKADRVLCGLFIPVF